MLNHFTFNGQSTRDFGLIVSGINIFGAPSRKVEKASVPGRNGDIMIELGGFNNYTVVYTVSIVDSFRANTRDIANWLLTSSGYNRLTDSYDPNHFRLASCNAEIEYMASALYKYGSATISFDCKPQRFLVSGEVEQTLSTSATNTVTNPTLTNARPIFEVTGRGEFYVNGITIETLEAGPITIDCEALQCYSGTTNKNSKVVIPEFPELVPGENIISTGSGVTALKLTPGWWEL